MHQQVSEERCQILCNNRSVKYRIWLSDEILLALAVADARALFEMLLEMSRNVYVLAIHASFFRSCLVWCRATRSTQFKIIVHASCCAPDTNLLRAGSSSSAISVDCSAGVER